MATNKRSWKFPLDNKRRTVELEHNVVTGRQLIVIDGVTIHRVKARYILTGDINFKIGTHTARVSISADDSKLLGGFRYALIVDGTPISSKPRSSRITRFYVTCLFEDGRNEQLSVEFEHETFDIWVQDKRCDPDEGEVEADFLEDGREGSVYQFSLPNGSPAQIQVTPCSGPTGSLARLFVKKNMEEVESSDNATADCPKAVVVPPPSSDIVAS